MKGLWKKFPKGQNKPPESSRPSVEQNSMKTLLKDGTIITMNSRREIFPQADLLIEGDRIKLVSQRLADRGNDADDVVDCKGKIIIPGLVSAHTHLTGMFQRGLWEETSFESWSRKSAATEQFFNPSPNDIYVIEEKLLPVLTENGIEFEQIENK